MTAKAVVRMPGEGKQVSLAGKPLVLYAGDPPIKARLPELCQRSADSLKRNSGVQIRGVKGGSSSTGFPSRRNMLCYE